jgi:hypothetical protein
MPLVPTRYAGIVELTALAAGPLASAYDGGAPEPAQ